MSVSLRRPALKSSLTCLVDDVLVDISDYLTRPRDLIHFGLTSRRVLACVSHALYAQVTLYPEQCVSTLRMFAQRPELARHIRSLTIHTGRESLLRHKQLSTLVASLATHLSSLHTFIWDGKEVPSNDILWRNLRISCPQLHTIGVTFGSHCPKPTSQLYNFTDLKGFHLALGGEFFYNYYAVDPPGWAPLWDMLIEKCPNLEELAVNGVSTRSSVALRLLQGRWPNLRKLSLGDLTTELSGGATFDPGAKRPFHTFLEAHDSLQHLQLSGQVNLPPASFAGMARTALPALKSFGGSVFQISTLRSYDSLVSLYFTEPLHLRSVIVPSVVAVLSKFPHLEKLRISFVVDADAQSGHLLVEVIEASSQLSSLDLTLGSRPVMTLNDYSLLMKRLPNLTRFKLAMIKHPLEKMSLGEGAIHIAHKFSSLESFTLAFASAGAPVHRQTLPSLDEFGDYEVLRDACGRPVILDAREETMSVAHGISDRPYLHERRHNYDKRFTYDLRTREVVHEYKKSRGPAPRNRVRWAMALPYIVLAIILHLLRGSSIDIVITSFFAKLFYRA